MHSKQAQHVFMGTITKPHGIRGEMALHTSAESPKILKGKALLAPPSAEPALPTDARPVTITQVRMHHQTALITIDGVNDRTAAENYRRHQIFIPRDRLPRLSDDEYYQTDILGLDVFIEETEEDIYLGVLDSIDIPAGQELWTIRTDSGTEVLLPAVPQFVKAIDLEEGHIIVTPPPGLVELYTKQASEKES